ncbi:DNA alkylation repair protein [Flavobacterium supellecticarium]|uniref:DNA alkylation repair protein n=1 Tax=Flavobacterium supellecticarium TaxID=2565924 RepID=A0A4S4A2S4_9FLAO|nr:DNA alkylation repair protein [Flavobacterium supellecticarium]THF52681.1 DNA alkylation repair protein [Flavobacterium supellecticarium]
MTFLTDLTQAFRENASADNAGPMEAYMKHHFQFYGIKAPLRKQITKQIWSLHKTEVKNNAREIGLTLLQQQQREFHYAAMEILEKELRGKFVKTDIELIEKTLTTDSWWDTVDFLAKYLLGNYLTQFPEETDTVISRFSDSDNMWLNRSAILFQLGYKSKTDAALLFALCEKHSGSGEFFIQKAIGWALREYAKTDPKAVIKFVSETTLKPLSNREALKNL